MIFALLETGVFADGKGTPSYQIVCSLDGGETWGFFRGATPSGLRNDPVVEVVARERLAEWRARLGEFVVRGG